MPIVQAVGIAVKADDPIVAQRIAEAMETALRALQTQGVTDPDLLRAAMLAARDTVQ